jgi:hypothetical protein
VYAGANQVILNKGTQPTADLNKASIVCSSAVSDKKENHELSHCQLIGITLGGIRDHL